MFQVPAGRGVIVGLTVALGPLASLHAPDLFASVVPKGHTVQANKHTYRNRVFLEASQAHIIQKGNIDNDYLIATFSSSPLQPGNAMLIQPGGRQLC